MRPQIVTILTLILVLLTGNTMLGQISGGGSTPPPPTGPPPELPLDSGIIILAIFGLALGIYTVVRKVRVKNSLR